MNVEIAAITFGLVAGLNPGPLGVFVTHQTLSKGYRSGMLACLAPILTDVPIVLVVLLLQLQIGELDWFLALVAILGSFYLLYLAYRIYHTDNSADLKKSRNSNSSLFDALKINYLNPNPYIFWLTIGNSYIAQGTKVEASLFVVLFISTLCLTKFGAAASIRLLGQRSNPRIYSVLLRCLSLPILIFSGMLFYYGINLIFES